MKNRFVIRRIRRFAFVAAGLIAVVAAIPDTTAAHGYKLGEISVGHLWSPPGGAGADGVPVYGAILNRGKTTVHLVGAATPRAGQTRFRTKKGDAVQWVKSIAFRPNRPLALAAWREHIWLSELKTTLKEGDSFPLTLDFGEAGRITVRVVVESAAGH